MKCMHVGTWERRSVYECFDFPLKFKFDEDGIKGGGMGLDGMRLNNDL